MFIIGTVGVAKPVDEHTENRFRSLCQDLLHPQKNTEPELDPEQMRVELEYLRTARKDLLQEVEKARAQAAQVPKLLAKVRRLEVSAACGPETLSSSRNSTATAPAAPATARPVIR